MDGAFSRGYLDLDFPVEPFTSAPRLLLRSAVVYLKGLPFLAGMTLLIVLPVKVAVQLVLSLLDAASSPTLSNLASVFSDLLAEAFLVPAVLFALVAQLRTGRLPAVGDMLRWGRRQYVKTLWNEFRAEITVALYTLLLIVPGIIWYVKLIFTETIVAIEGDLTSEVLDRSRRLTEGRRWRIFAVIAPISVLSLAVNALVLYGLRPAPDRWYEAVAAETALSLIGLWSTVAAFLMYLGLVIEPKENTPKWKLP